jgi:hypothetical protein
VKGNTIHSHKEYREIRRQAGLTIDPETAEVEWRYGHTLDPYGLEKDLPAELQQVGREYFARSAGNDIWVSFGDLPKQTRDGPLGKALVEAGISGRFASGRSF